MGMPIAGAAQELELPQRTKAIPSLLRMKMTVRKQKLDRNLENGMAVSIGRLRPDYTVSTIKFVCLSHNTLRGAAGGAVLMAELLCAKGLS